MDKIQILIVEDNIIIAKAVQMALEHMDYSVPDIVATGDGAINAVRENNVDLVLMDIVLSGGMDGIETAHHIQSKYKIPVVYLTSHTDESTLKRAKITAPYGYLVKPVSESEMRITIEMALYKFRTEQELMKHREQLAALVEERTAELTKTNELLQQEIAERKILEKAILETEERELRRIGCELHDGLGQLLTAVSLKTQSLEDELKERSMPEAKSAERVTLLIDKAKAHLKLLMQGNFPMEKNQKNIISLLEEFSSRATRDYKIPCRFTCKSVSIKNEAAVIHLYRIAQEAATNALKHAAPEFVEIGLSQTGNLVTMTVNDNGKGIPEQQKNVSGMGLKIMRYRANMIGASFTIRSTVNAGTCITCAYDDKSDTAC